jgi:hypothetical protein
MANLTVKMISTKRSLEKLEAVSVVEDDVKKAKAKHCTQDLKKQTFFDW